MPYVLALPLWEKFILANRKYPLEANTKRGSTPLPPDSRRGRPEVWGGPFAIRERGNYFFAMKVYLPSSSDSLSIQMTVHLPSPLNLAFTAPFFVSYTAHTSSLFSETLHS